jgi:hypothetical protein
MAFLRRILLRNSSRVRRLWDDLKEAVRLGRFFQRGKRVKGTLLKNFPKRPIPTLLAHLSPSTLSVLV